MEDIKIIAIANHKGGVGKTTFVTSTAPLLAKAGYRVLMIDLDPQCSLTESFIDFAPKNTILDAFLTPKTGSKDIIINWMMFKEPIPNLDLIPASPELAANEPALNSRTARERLLEKILRNLNVGKDYDIVMMDCAPDMYLYTINALVACNELFVPTTAEYLSVAGLKKLEDKCEELAEDFNPDLRISGIIVNRFNKGKNLNVSADEALRGKYGDIVFKTRIRENIRLAESPQFMQSISNYAPTSNGALDYAEITQEIIDRFENDKH